MLTAQVAKLGVAEDTATVVLDFDGALFPPGHEDTVTVASNNAKPNAADPQVFRLVRFLVEEGVVLRAVISGVAENRAYLTLRTAGTLDSAQVRTFYESLARGTTVMGKVVNLSAAPCPGIPARVTALIEGSGGSLPLYQEATRRAHAELNAAFVEAVNALLERFRAFSDDGDEEASA